MTKKKIFQINNIELIRAGAKGISVGKTSEGKTIIVKGGVPGDIVDVSVHKSKKKYLEASVLNFIKYSKYRIDAKCEYFGICGGCTWQNLTYEKQLELKQEEVFNNIKKIGKVDSFEEVGIEASDNQYFYRNKMEFSFSNSRWLTLKEIRSGIQIENKNAVGFHIPGQWSKVLDIKKCFLQEEPSNQIRNSIREFALNNKMDFYDFNNSSGFLRTLMLKNNSKGEWMVFIQFFREEKENIKNLLNYLIEKFAQVKTVLYAINPKGNDSIYDLDIINFYGKGFLDEEIEGFKFRIGPKSFFQTNYRQAVKLYNITRDFANLQKDDLVYDLYTGTGTIAQFISSKVKKVVGVEAVPEAIEAAKENIKLNNIKNCYFYCGDMKDIFSDEFILENGKPDVIITDPPRDGMHKNVVETILRISPKKIVYVSCNSATQARDIEMMKNKYNLLKIQPVDMFPQTFHVESVALLELKK